MNQAHTQGLEVAASSPEFLCNAVAVTRDGELFLGLPRWTGMDATPSVVRVAADGHLQPFPGGSWNAWSAGQPAHEAFVQVNALHIFGDDTLWVVDQGTPDREHVIPGAQKVLQFDTRSGALLRSLRFDDSVLPPGAQLNDLRIWGGRVYLTDSGRGAIIVHDLDTGASWRRLDGDPQLLPSDALPMRGSGRRILADGNGKRPRVATDFLELSPDGQWLYVGTPTGPIRRVATALLNDPSVADAAISATITEVVTIPTLNGTAMDTLGNLYLADAEQRRIEVVAPSGLRAVLVADTRLINPDALFITGARRLYIPATQNELLPESNEGRSATQPPFLVLTLQLPQSIDGIALGEVVVPPVSPIAVVDPSLSRGVEHIGITVPDHDAAVLFFKHAFGAEPLFSLVRKGEEPMCADALHAKNGLAPGTAIVAVSLLRMRHGANIEIFEIDHPHGEPGQGIADFGISHFSVTVDDMDAVTSRFVAAGGTLLDGPYALSGQEQGSGNLGRFGRTPWGLLIEFECFRSPISYDTGARSVRWFPACG